VDRLKETMSWRELTQYVMDNHREWVAATWPEGSPRTEEAESDVKEYLRKVWHDYRHRHDRRRPKRP
jgi:hypothetical protein